jgi:hypothetical protein
MAIFSSTVQTGSQLSDPAHYFNARTIMGLFRQFSFATWPQPDTNRPFGACGRGGIGRRAALRSLWGNSWKFESSRPHQRSSFC